jgi:hypothetical protein
VRVQILERAEVLDWKLRRGFEWQDFKFLTNSRLGHDKWRAEFADRNWDGREVSGGRLVNPLPGQEIFVLDLESISKAGDQRFLEKIQKKRAKLSQERHSYWYYVVDHYKHWNNWEWDEDDEEKEEALKNRLGEEIEMESHYVIIELPATEDLLSMQLPKGNEWAYFTSFMDNYFGENKWIAGFSDGCENVDFWEDASMVPKPFQFIRVRTLTSPIRKCPMTIEEEMEAFPECWPQSPSELSDWRECLENCSKTLKSLDRSLHTKKLLIIIQ